MDRSPKGDVMMAGEVTPRPGHRRSLYRDYLVSSAALFALTGFVSSIGITDTNVVAFWPACGLTLWMVWRLGPPAAVVIFVVYAAFGLLFLEHNTFFSSASNAVGALAGGTLLRHRYRAQPEDAVTDLLWVLGGASAVQAVISGLLGGSELVLSLGLSVQQTVVLVLRWVLSDLAGTVTLAPILFFWSLRGPAPRPHAALIESLATVGALAASFWLAHTSLHVLSVSAKLLLPCAPVVFWMATRPFSRATVVCLGLIGSTILTLAAQVLNEDARSLLETQLFMLVFLTSAYLIQMLVLRQVTLNARLAQERVKLEERVIERTRELNEAKARAEAADHAKSEFLANTSHEVRTPLNAILGMAEFLFEADLEPEYKRQARTIVTAGRSLMSLLNDIIDLSKVEAGKLIIVPEPTRVGELAEHVDVLWRTTAVEKGLYLDIHVQDGGHGALVIDPQRVLQCISNLVSNAVKFTERGGVSVTFELDGGDDTSTLTVRVTDSGIGMDAEAMQRLFRPFEQADASISRRFGGAGLGLSITRKLASMMGGDIAVQSEPGHGTQFTLTVRGASVNDRCTGPVAASDPQNVLLIEGLRVLLVEDNKVNRMVVKGHMRRYGMHFTEVENGLQALEQLKTARFDLVLMDVHMPVMDGIEAIQQIRSSGDAYSKVPVIALTADAMIEDRQRLLALGMDGYASKPIDRQALVHEIQQVLRA